MSCENLSMPSARIAVAGAGLIGRKHIEVLNSSDASYSLAAVVDPSPEAAAAAHSLGYNHYPDLITMLDAEAPDGVVIAVPNQLHTEVGLACIARDIPILIEKPVADTLQDALRLVSAAEATNVPTLTGHHRRHNPLMQTAARMISDGKIGQVVTASSTWLTHKPAGYHDLSWRREPGGGPILINAIHEIDCLRMLCGEIESIQAAHSSAVRGFAVEDTVVAIIRFASGALGTLTLSDTVVSPWSWETTSGENSAFPVADNADSIIIGGTEGSLAIPSLTLHSQEAGKQNWLAPLTISKNKPPQEDPYYAQMRNFADVIAGRSAPVLTGRDGLITLAATLAISESAKSGQIVRVKDQIESSV